MPQNPLDKGKPGENPETPTTTPPAPTGSKPPLPPSGSKLPFPPPGSKLPIPPPSGKLPLPPPSRGGLIPPKPADGAPGRGMSPERGGFSSRASGRGGRIPRSGPPLPPPGMEGLAPPPTRGGILGAPGRRGGMYGPRGRGSSYGGPGLRGMNGARGRGGFAPHGPDHEGGEPSSAARDSIKVGDMLKLSLGKVIRAIETIAAVVLIFLHGSFFHVTLRVSIVQMTTLVAFPIYLLARLSCSLWKRRWIPAVVDALFSLLAALNYIAVCFFEIAILADIRIVPLSNTHRLKFNQIAICFKIFFSTLLTGLLIFDCFVHFTRLKNMKLYCTF